MTQPPDVTQFTPLLDIYEEPYTEQEASDILDTIRVVLDVPRRKSDPPTKTVLIDFFGTANAGKTVITAKIEQFLRRNNFRVFAPPETAEIAEIRNRSTDNPLVFQARHLAGVQNYVLNLSQDRNFHAVIISRGLIDMLYWYEKGVREGLYSETNHQSVRGLVFELLRMDLVDAFFFFTCSAEIALQREYNESLTQKRGSNMTEGALAESLDIYRAVLEDVEANVPRLPIFRIDTTDLNIKDTAQEVLRHLLPTLCTRCEVSGAQLFPRSLTLMKKKSAGGTRFEEQLKLRGHPPPDKLRQLGWTFTETKTEDDTYLNPHPEQVDSDGAFGEIIRIRRKDDKLEFIFKSLATDRIFSHRRPLRFDITPQEAIEVQELYQTILKLSKIRGQYRLNREFPEDPDHFFTLHCDTLEGIGEFTEIRALGSGEITHTNELLELATELGFTPRDIVEGSYLALALANRSKLP